MARHGELRHQLLVRFRGAFLAHRQRHIAIEPAEPQAPLHVPDAVVPRNPVALEANDRVARRIEEAQAAQVTVTQPDARLHRETFDLAADGRLLMVRSRDLQCPRDPLERAADVDDAEPPHAERDPGIIGIEGQGGGRTLHQSLGAPRLTQLTMVWIWLGVSGPDPSGIRARPIRRAASSRMAMTSQESSALPGRTSTSPIRVCAGVFTSAACAAGRVSTSPAWCDDSE